MSLEICNTFSQDIFTYYALNIRKIVCFNIVQDKASYLINYSFL